jgi:sugar/nucleoside kinase (ribokinase family)
MADILGMGNALVDLMTKIDSDAVLDALHLPKGSMQLVDAQTSMKVADYTAGYPTMIASGGSAANTIHGLAKLGVSTAFIGTVGEDETGDFFHKDMVGAGVQPYIFRSQTPSGLAIALVTPDGERTFATHLGAAIELSVDFLHPDLFSGHKYFYVEGYLVQNEELLLKAMNLASQSGLKIALDLASYNVVEAKKDFLLHLLKTYVDIVFANEEEAKAICGFKPEPAVDFLSGLCETAIVKTGAKGALIKQGNELTHVPALQANPIDTTGAGDMFAAGFLYGHLHNFNLEMAGMAGNMLAASVIEVMGAKMDNQKWIQTRIAIENLYR